MEVTSKLGPLRFKHHPLKDIYLNMAVIFTWLLVFNVISEKKEYNKYGERKRSRIKKEKTVKCGFPFKGLLLEIKFLKFFI